MLCIVEAWKRIMGKQPVFACLSTTWHSCKEFFQIIRTEDVICQVTGANKYVFKDISINCASLLLEKTLN